ncbi:hypothetical protein [uncultured Clostridium sp.]|uniref:hypothetical protein n=1 Tax=uncultured Clostridium sp. TaxID=59620 RepID=UPI00258CA508|nr:hypothetical protein [uncultured Clostridium sp.]
MLFRFEIKKTFSSGILLGIIFLSIILNLFIFYNSQGKDNFILINNKERYYSLAKEEDSNLKILNDEIDLYSYIAYVNTIDDSFSNEKDITINSLLEKDKDIINKYNKSIYLNDNEALERDKVLVSKLLKQKDYISSYNEYLDGVEEQKDKMLSVSIFNKKGTFSYNNILKTAEDFKNLRNANLKLDIEEGVTSITNYYFADTLIIFIAFILCTVIFSNERETDILPLIKSTKNGRARLIFAKIVILFILLAFISIILYGSITILSSYLYGFGDVSRDIQSINEFKGSILRVNIAEYIRLYLLTKISSSLLIGGVFSLIFQINKNIVKNYISVILVLVISFLFLTLLPVNSYLNFFKYVNILTFLFTPYLLKQYININFFTIPINIILAYKIFIFIILPIIIALNILLFSREREYKKKWISIDFIKKIRAKISKNTTLSSLFANEIYKDIVQNKLYLILLIVLIISFKSINFSKNYNYTTEEKTYKYYINNLGGEITSDKQTEIEKEKYFFDNVNEYLDNLSLKISNNEISENEYRDEQRKVTTKLNLYKKSFLDFYNQHLYLNNLEYTRNINGVLLDKSISEKLILNEDKDLTEGLIISTLLIILLSNIFAFEYKTGNIYLIRGSKNKKKLLLDKYLISILISIFIYVLISLPRYINVFNEFGYSFLYSPIQSIEEFYNFAPNINILYFLILTNIFKVLGVLIISNLIANISLITKNNLFTIIISTFLLIPSYILNFIGIETMNRYTLVNIFNINNSIIKDGNLIFNLIYYAVLILLLIIGQGISNRFYEGERIIKRWGSNEFRNKGC